MGRYEGLADVAKKLKAFDNEVKLSIVVLLTEEGAKSITDISQSLNLNFSTAHKYLEQLERAGIVTSKQVSENRLKRLFSVNNFSINLSPEGITNLLNSQPESANKGVFKVINESGNVTAFDSTSFSSKYLKLGLPQNLVHAAVDYVIDKGYNGITLMELRKHVKEFLSNRTKLIESAAENIDKLQKVGSTYEGVLAIMRPEALQMHMDGFIFIKNLGRPKLLNFVHDIRGIVIHGVTGKVPKNLSEFTKQFEYLLKSISKSISPAQSLENFNYFMATMSANLSEESLYSELSNFYDMLSKHHLSFNLGLDMGDPRYFSAITPTYYHVPDGLVGNYSTYKATAEKILNILVKLKKKKPAKNIHLTFKCWDSKTLAKAADLCSTVDACFIANMAPAWQTTTASYVGKLSRFDCNWRGWMRVMRTGEIQNISINCIKLAKESSSIDAFIKQISSAVRKCAVIHQNMSILNLGEFMRISKTWYPSAQREKWVYLPIDDCQYSIALADLPSAIKLISKKDVTGNCKKILEIVNTDLKKETENVSIRLALKEEYSLSVKQRFASINKTDVLTETIPSELHNLLPGGHCATINLEELPKAITKKFGLLFVRH